MTTEATLEKLVRVFASQLKIDPSEVTRETSMDSLDKWDSLRHMRLILAIEEEFSIEFSDDEVADMTSVAIIMESIGEHIGL